MKRSLSSEKFELLLEKVIERGCELNYIQSTHRLEVSLASQLIGYLRLPLQFDFTNNKLIAHQKKIAIIIIQSGSASVALYQSHKLLDHKTFSSYMVRKKQGKSQIKHLKTKGKSRAGSRVRLANTLLFFEDINTRLQTYEKKQPYRIAFSCSKNLLPFLYKSKVAHPFDKKDDRIFKINKHIEQANHQSLKDCYQYLCQAEVLSVGDTDELWHLWVQQLFDA